MPDFNSKRQRDEITKTLSLSARIMDNSPERRNEIRDFVSKLQQRIVSKYMSRLLDIAGHYKCVDAKQRKTLDLSPFLTEKLYKKSLGDDIPCLVDRAVDGFEFLVIVTCKI